MRRRHKPTDLAEEREARDLTDAFIAPLLPEHQLDRDSTPVSRATVDLLEARVAELEQQVLAQFSALAAYATIAEQAVDTARAEARSDLDRNRTTILGLVDQLHREVLSRGTGSAEHDGRSQLDALAGRIDDLTGSLDQVVRQQRELAASVAELVEHRMAQDGWLAGSSGPASLSLR
jgi:hypothetical protein